MSTCAEHVAVRDESFRIEEKIVLLLENILYLLRERRRMRLESLSDVPTWVHVKNRKDASLGGCRIYPKKI